MKPTKFKRMNVVCAKDQPEYLPLPAHINEAEGLVTSCWSANLKERIRFLLTGRIYLTLLTFNKPLQPQVITVYNPINGTEPKDSE